MLQRLIDFFLPERLLVSSRERWLAAFLAFVAMLFIAGLSQPFVGPQGLPYVVASMGASGVLLFALPQSPLSQPWPLVGGHLISAVVGVLCYRYVPDLRLAAALTVGLSIALMYFTHSLHPPGGAAGLGAVVGGSEIHELGFTYVLVPVGLNVLLLLAIAMVLNNAVNGRRYPLSLGRKRQRFARLPGWGLGRASFSDRDLQAALQDMGVLMDISREDLNKIYSLAVLEANKRRLGEVACRDIMTPDPLALEYATELEQAWALMQAQRLKAVPVVDRFRRVIGVVTVADFVAHASARKGRGPLLERLGRMLGRSPEQEDEETVIGQIMSTPAITVAAERHVMEVINVFTEAGIHHLPVVDERKKLVGMVTRADIMRAMSVCCL